MTPGRGPRRLPDAADREHAATVFDRNLVVTAGAGTGKTALLVERALNLIAGAEIPVDAIAAITFTEKAAAELRQRLASGLDDLRRLAEEGAATGAADAALPDDTSEARRAYAWLRKEAGIPAGAIRRRAVAALDRFDAATVATIHAFCSEILRRYPREAGVDPSFAVDEGPGFSTLFEEVWEEFLAGELGPAAPRTEVWRQALLVPEALGAIRDLGSALAAFGIPSSALAERAAYAPASIRDLLGPRIAAARDAALSILSRATGMNPRMKDFLSSSFELLTAFLDGGGGAMAAVTSPMALDEYLKTSEPAPGRGLAGAEPEEVTRAARGARGLVKRLSKVDEKIIASLVTAALPLAASAREKMLAAGLVSFDGLLRLTRDLLAARPEIRRDLAVRWPNILVDEFQDTDPLQYEILFFIAEEEGPPASDAYRTRLAPGRLFIVGDPKQSIYRFRGADIEAYRRAVDHVIACGGGRSTLTASFRSPSEIVDPINRLFEGWIGTRAPSETVYEPPYEPIAAARGAAGGGPRIEIWSVDEDGNAEARRRAEAAAIAAWIGENVGGAAATGEPLAYGGIAILLRALTNVSLYTQALRRAGIPYVVEGGRDFYERPEVTDLLAFLRAAVNPSDGASVLAVMRSPLGGVPDAELARFAAAGGRLDRPDGDRADPGAFPNVRRTLLVLREFRLRMIGRPPDAVIRSVFDQTPLAILHASSFDGAQRLANLRKIVAAVENLARRGLSLEETLRFVEEEFESQRSEGESPLADETVDAVRILSVHKAKGLEYRVVFVPDIGRAPNRGDPPATEVSWVARAEGGWLAVRLGGDVLNAAWAFKAEEDRLHETAEEKRVFYVACTRARERLILVNSNAGGSAPWRAALRALGYEVDDGFPDDGLLADGLVVHRRLEARGIQPGAAAAGLDPIWTSAAARFVEVSEAAAASAAPPLRWPAGVRDERIAEAALTADLPLEGGEPGGRARPASRDVARLAGTAVHAALEKWNFRDPAGIETAVKIEAVRVAREADPTGRDRSLGANVEGEAARIVEGLIASPLPARLAQSEILGREVPVLLQDETGAAWIGSCDLVYRDGDGVFVVADYKTDLVEGDPGRAAGRYEGQVRVYVEALRRALPGAAVRGELLFVRSGHVVPIS